MMKFRTTVVFVLLVILMTLAPIARAEIINFPFTQLGGGQVTVTFDYEANNGDVKKFYCENSSPYDAWFGVYERIDGVYVLLYERVCPSNDTTVQVVAGTTLAWDTVDGGLIFGPYSFAAVWPYIPVEEIQILEVIPVEHVYIDVTGVFRLSLTWINGDFEKPGGGRYVGDTYSNDDTRR
jgi:hypothetical protein